MGVSSINIQTSSSNSSDHMSRKSYTSYLIEPDSKNNEYVQYLDQHIFLEEAKLLAKEKTGRTMQKKAVDNFTQEAILNLEQHHTLDDVKKVFEKLKNKFGGFEIFEIAVHKDEGYFYHKKEEIEYRPGADIFFNQKDRNFYLDKDFKTHVDLNQFEKRYNYHAHVNFTKFDKSKGKNARLNKSDMRKMQTIVAKSLGMERGEEFSKSKRRSHWQIKNEHDKARDVKVNMRTLMQQKATSEAHDILLYKYGKKCDELDNLVHLTDGGELDISTLVSQRDRLDGDNDELYSENERLKENVFTGEDIKDMEGIYIPETWKHKAEEAEGKVKRLEKENSTLNTQNSTLNEDLEQYQEIGTPKELKRLKSHFQQFKDFLEKYKYLVGLDTNKAEEVIEDLSDRVEQKKEREAPKQEQEEDNVRRDF
jgi:hypothetical protein